jgi:hypothetical protein
MSYFSRGQSAVFIASLKTVRPVVGMHGFLFSSIYK